MDAVEEAFYDAEGDEAPDVDVVEEGQILQDPCSQGETLPEGGIQCDQIDGMDLGIIFFMVFLDIGGCDIEFGYRGRYADVTSGQRLGCERR